MGPAVGGAQGVWQGAQRAQQAEAGQQEAREQAAAPGQGDQQAGHVLGPGAALGLLQVHERPLQAADLHF